MDKVCQNCKEPTDNYHIMHDEINDKGQSFVEFLESPDVNLDSEIISFNGYKIRAYLGINEIPEGHYALLECPFC